MAFVRRNVAVAAPASPIAPRTRSAVGADTAALPGAHGWQIALLPGVRGRTVSLYMLALCGGLSVGSLATGLTVSLLGVREALLINGLLVVLVQLLLGYFWFRPRPGPLPARSV